MTDVKKQKQERELKIRRGEKTLKILEILAEGAVFTYALAAAFAPGTTYSMARNIKKLPKEIKDFFEDIKQERQFYGLLSHLQQTGLIVKKRKGSTIQWLITGKGREKIDQLNYSFQNSNLLPPTIYPAEKSDELVIVIFDIPERYKFKRDWFRGVLQNLGLVLVQKSVWMGNIKIPTELIEELKHLNILSFIKIFSVTKVGNLDWVK